MIGGPEAISWHWIGPVTVDVRGSQHLSCAPRRNRIGKRGVVRQRPDLPLSGDRDPISPDGDFDGPVEPVEGERQLPIGDADGYQLTRLIGRYNKAPGFGQHARK